MQTMILVLRFLVVFGKSLWNIKRQKLCSERAEGNVALIVGVFVLLAVYLASPDLIHNFIQTLIHMFFDALHSAFDSGEKSDFGTKPGGDGAVGPDGKIDVPDPEKRPQAK